MLSQQDRREFTSKAGMVLWTYVILPLALTVFGISYARHGINWALITPTLLIAYSVYRVFTWAK